jgi:hypothetical protein
MAGVAPMPTVGGSAAGLSNDVNNLAPLATSWGGPDVGVPVNQNVRTSSYSPGGSSMSKFTTFLGSVGSSIGHVATGAAAWLAHNTVQMVTSPYHFEQGISHGLADRNQLSGINTRNQQFSDQLTTLHQQFKEGKISKDTYTTGLQTLGSHFQDLSKQSSALNNRIGLDQKNTVKAAIDTAALVTTVLTAGAGKAISAAIAKNEAVPGGEVLAANFLSSSVSGVNAVMGKVESAVNHFATNPVAFGKLELPAQKALQTATAEVVAQGGNMTAPQIARATAANLALKYPIYFNAMDSSAHDVYNQLDNKKYGAAVRSLAVNAMFLLSGGAIGQALRYGGKFASAAGQRTFGQTSFWDELSKSYGNQNTNGFTQAIANVAKGMNDVQRTEFFKNLSAVEATNLHATGGDAAAAALRVAEGMKHTYGFDLKTVTHDQGLQDMVKYADNFRTADTAAKAAGLGPIAVGRFDVRAKSAIATQVTAGDNSSAWLKNWEQVKAANPDQAYANSDSLDKQMKDILTSSKSSQEVQRRISGIKATTSIEGFPKSVADKLAKEGYVAIQPKNLQAPFKEGSGKIVTNFGQGHDFFTHAVQPLPVLGQVGDLLTKMGLSPQASSQRVYSLFHDELQKNFGESAAIKNYGDRVVAEQVATDAAKPVAERFSKIELQTLRENSIDNIIKQLSNFAHDPTRGGYKGIRPPITDLRQFTTKDVQHVLGMSAADAREVKGAIMDAHLQVPFSVKGPGDRLVDINYKVNPAAAPYTRVQGALRFAWNPFFDAKLNYKSEILAQAEAGGKFPTLLGTNFILRTLFADKYAQLDNVTNLLRDRGIFSERAVRGTVITGEGIDSAGLSNPNLTHALLPGQERSIAGLVSVQADKAGMNVHDFIDNFPHQVNDTVQMIAQYDRHNSLLNSPLTRTLNFAFFPFRFELKVASIMAHSLAQTSAMTQFAVIKGLYQGTEWIKSPEGQVWYARNSEVIQLMKYFSPLSTLSTVAAVLGDRKGNIGSFGELGGLPFGWIPQLLDASGVTHFGTNQPFINSKDGSVLPQYIPTTDKGRLSLAIQDFIQGLYTWPGSTLGLPSKLAADRKIGNSLSGATTKNDFTPVTPALTPDAAKYQKLIQQQNPQQAQPQPVTQPPQQSFKVPATSTPITQPISKGSGKKAKTPRPKKADFRPAVLPGQPGIGQL